MDNAFQIPMQIQSPREKKFEDPAISTDPMSADCHVLVSYYVYWGIQVDIKWSFLDHVINYDDDIYELHP